MLIVQFSLSASNEEVDAVRAFVPAVIVPAVGKNILSDHICRSHIIVAHYSFLSIAFVVIYRQYVCFARTALTTGRTAALCIGRDKELNDATLDILPSDEFALFRTLESEESRTLVISAIA